MKRCRKSSIGSRKRKIRRNVRSGGRHSAGNNSSAFTLIEIMLVVAIMGLIMAMGMPPIMHAMKPDPIRKAAMDLRDVCANARARAILSGQGADVVFHPQEKRFEISGGGSGGKASIGEGVSGELPDSVNFTLLEVNLRSYLQADTATVHFFANGTCDEMHVVLHSDKDEWRAVTLEVTTALADIETDMNKLRFK